MEDPIAVAKAEAAKQAVILVFAVITMAVFMAATKPDFLRTWRMRLAEASRRLLDFMARHAGHNSMGIELATGTEAYSLPYLLSQLRDRAAQTYHEESDNG